MNLFRFLPGYEDEIFRAGKEPLLLLLLSFMLAFALTRLYTRLARRHGWSSGRLGGVHVHHMVPGLVLVLVAGLMSFSTYQDPRVVALAAVAFGAGAALVLDEFALVFHLDDVYWADEGRQSVVATVVGAALVTLMLVVTAPFGIQNEAFGDRNRLTVFALLIVNAVFALTAFVKGKPFIGTAAIFVPFLGLVGAVRLAHPSSPWAHVVYDGPKLERARARFRRCLGQRLRNRVVATIGGFHHHSSSSTG